ncbi:MAG TPA: hypothetical protein VH207_05060 [Chthoniobacterales bacterium]|jgi:hypothetical protein|nr:hypothetical protein [Chthoniobacterales bacterium]
MNDTLIFLVLAGLALLFKWLTSQGSSDSKKPEPPPPNEQARPQRPPAESEEERVRRFLEALGMPAGTQPPPPVRPRRVVTPSPAQKTPKVKRSWVQPLPPLVTTPQEMPPLPPVTTVPPEVVVIEETPPPVVAPPPIPASAIRRSAPRLPAAPTSLAASLRTPGNIRRAIVLREVLGPPRGLQALDELRRF